jgi:hypothetical protein
MSSTSIPKWWMPAYLSVPSVVAGSSYLNFRIARFTWPVGQVVPLGG